MKTGFICASGFNLVATATRNNKRLIAVVLGAPSGAVRAIKAAEMLESGFSQNPLSWLTPSLGMVDALAPMDVAPPNLQEQTCGKHRKRPAAEDEDMDADSDNPQPTADTNETRSFLLSALRAPTNPVLLSDLGPVMPVVVYTGPTRSPSQLATLSSDVAADPENTKKKTKHKATAARSTDDEAAPEKPANKKSVVAKPTDAKATEAKPTDTKPAAKPSDTKTAAQAGAPAAAPKKQAKPKPVATPPAQ